MLCLEIGAILAADQHMRNGDIRLGEIQLLFPLRPLTDIHQRIQPAQDHLLAIMAERTGHQLQHPAQLPVKRCRQISTDPPRGTLMIHKVHWGPVRQDADPDPGMGGQPLLFGSSQSKRRVGKGRPWLETAGQHQQTDQGAEEHDDAAEMAVHKRETFRAKLPGETCSGQV